MPAVRLNKSASRTVDILTLIAGKEKPVTISEVAKTLNIPKSSTFELIYTLVEKGFLQAADENANSFKLGLKLFEVGAAFLTKTDLHREARPVMERLFAETDKTVFLAVEDQGSLVYLDKLEQYSSVRTTATLGSRKLMHCTGLGKALLAAYPPEKIRKITGGGPLVPQTDASITDYDVLLADLAAIRARGFATDNCENEAEVFCIAAPIYDRWNQPIAAISITVLATSITEEKIQYYGKLVAKSALHISHNLGFLGEKLYF